MSGPGPADIQQGRPLKTPFKDEEVEAQSWAVVFPRHLLLGDGSQGSSAQSKFCQDPPHLGSCRVLWHAPILGGHS